MYLSELHHMVLKAAQTLSHCVFSLSNLEQDQGEVWLPVSNGELQIRKVDCIGVGLGLKE